MVFLPGIVPLRLSRYLIKCCSSAVEVALCLHRVGKTRNLNTALPDLIICEEKLDKLLRNLAVAFELRDQSKPVLTVTFDDGYFDAYNFIFSRAKQYPQFNWIFFICPQKLLKRAGFRWDLYARTFNGEDLDNFCFNNQNIKTENDRSDLKEVCASDIFSLASVADCRALIENPNVFLGNHTNCHFRTSCLSCDEARLEISESFADFAMLFGNCDHFAFPIGTPVKDFSKRDVDLVREVFTGKIWSLEQNISSRSHDGTWGTFPRIGINGRLSLRAILFKIAFFCVRRTALDFLRFKMTRRAQ